MQGENSPAGKTSLSLHGAFIQCYQTMSTDYNCQLIHNTVPRIALDRLNQNVKPMQSDSRCMWSQKWCLPKHFITLVMLYLQTASTLLCLDWHMLSSDVMAVLFLSQVQGCCLEHGRPPAAEHCVILRTLHQQNALTQRWKLIKTPGPLMLQHLPIHVAIFLLNDAFWTRSCYNFP